MNKLLKRIVMTLLILMFAIGLVSCGNTDNKANNENGNNSSGQVSYPLKLTDSFGKEVTLDKEPEKVISVAPNITELIYKLGAEGKLIGRTDYCDYPAEVSKIESIGSLTKPDIEKIISLEPDLVIASTHFSDENTVKLEDAGIKVMGMYEENNVEGVYTMIETVGKALNKETAAKDTVDNMKSTINEVTTAVKDLKEPTVYYVVGFGEYGDFSAPENSFVGGLIKLAGGNDIVPASTSWSYSLEALLAANPDIIVLKNGDKAAFETTEGYKDLTAVKEGRVYEIDNNLLDRQGYRNAEGVQKLAEIFHPEAFN